MGVYRGIEFQERECASQLLVGQCETNFGRLAAKGIVATTCRKEDRAGTETT